MNSEEVKCNERLDRYGEFPGQGQVSKVDEHEYVYRV